MNDVKSYLELYNNTFNGIVDKFPILNVVEKYDTEQKVFCEIKVSGNIDYTRTNYCYWFNNFPFFGKVDKVKQEDDKATLYIAIGADALDHKIEVTEGNVADIEQLIINKLTNEFVGNDPYSDLPLIFDKVTTTSGYIYVQNGLIDFSTLANQVLRLYNIHIQLVYINDGISNKIKVVVENKGDNSVKISENSNVILHCEKTFNDTVITKYKLIGASTSYTFFLKNDGGITTNINDPDRFKYVVPEKEIDTGITNSTQALTKAREKLYGQFNNQIKLLIDNKRVSKDVQGKRLDDLLNTYVSFILDNKSVISTRITAIEKSDSTGNVTYILGGARNSLADFIRKGGR